MIFLYSVLILLTTSMCTAAITSIIPSAIAGTSTTQTVTLTGTLIPNITALASPFIISTNCASSSPTPIPNVSLGNLGYVSPGKVTLTVTSTGASLGVYSLCTQWTASTPYFSAGWFTIAGINALLTPGVFTVNSSSVLSLSGGGFSSGDTFKVVQSSLQIAGDLYVNVDATLAALTSQISSIPNTGSLGGCFSGNIGVVSVTSVGPMNTAGITFSGSASWLQLTQTPMGAVMKTPFSITGNGPSSIEVWAFNPSVQDAETLVGWGTDSACNYHPSTCTGGVSTVHCLHRLTFSQLILEIDIYIYLNHSTFSILYMYTV